jgi:hypothetical protein
VSAKGLVKRRPWGMRIDSMRILSANRAKKQDVVPAGANFAERSVSRNNRPRRSDRARLAPSDGGGAGSEKEATLSISAMAATAMTRRTDFVIPPLQGADVIAGGQIRVPPMAPSLPRTIARVPAPPAAPGAIPFPVPPAQPSGVRVPTAPAQPSGAQSGSQSTAAATSASTAVSAALQAITTYIPGEILTLYVAVLAAIRDTSTQHVAFSSALAAFVTFLFLTPAAVWLIYATRVRGLNPKAPLPRSFAALPIWEMVAATLAYIAWALALPDSPFSQAISPVIQGVTPVTRAMHAVTPAVGGVLVLITSTLLSLAAPVFKRPLSA